jgi:ribosome-binding factor A
MQRNYKRSDRVGDLIREEVASMILHGEIKDHRVGFVTITHVKMSADLKDAKVYFSQIGRREEKTRSREGLNHASGYVRRALAKRLSLKHIPTVSFFFDDSLEYAEHIEKVIKDIKKGGGL